MLLSSIEVLNFRNISDIDVRLDESLTVIVGKNNSGKTSFMKAIYNVLEKDDYCYYDYPLQARKELLDSLKVFQESDYLKNTFSEIQNIQKGTSVIFNIDYAKDIASSELGFLSEFIIDLDPSVNNAKIEAKYNFMINKDNLIELIQNYHRSCLDYDFIESNFSKFFKLQVFTHSINNKEDIRKVDLNNLKQLIRFSYLDAERFMDEANSSSSESLNQLIKKLFNNEFKNTEEYLKKKVNSLKDSILELSDNLQKQIDVNLSEIVDEARKFTGYPGVDELPLGVKSSIELLESISQNNIALVYKDNLGNELPNGNNGLGYKNLINIVLQIQNYIDSLDLINFVGIPLLMIEEPESHMHPQLQTTFTKFIKQYIDEVSDKQLNFQLVLTTHSSHIANSTKFEGIRYFKKAKSSCIIKDLRQFYDDDDNIKFLKKYMTLSNCDIYFADKLILLEGAGERLLINNMIEKVSDNIEIDQVSNNIPLKSQYISFIEVGGAYAYVFIKFITFLEIPSLIITDLDPMKHIVVSEVEKTTKKCLCEEGEISSNSTINRWYRKNVDNLDGFEIFQKKLPKNKDEIAFSKIIEMNESQKLMDKIILAFQVKEPKTEYIGRSLEQAIIAANPKIYLANITNIKEKDIENAFNKSSKMDFALELLMDKEKEGSPFKVPEYIKQGLEKLAKIDYIEDN